MADDLNKSTQLSLFFPVSLLFLLITTYTNGQDLDPRAYVRLPINTYNLITGYSYSQGGVVTDPTLPISNINAKVHTPSAAFLYSFSFFGLSSTALVALPYSSAKVSGQVGEQDSSIIRNGMSDLRLRFTVLLLGGKAATLAELRKAPRKTILGASLNVVAPSGQFFPDKLINLGVNRWGFRPELALSHPFAKRWLLDAYASVWFFTDNNTFYPGNSVRHQEPMGSFQAHLSYNIRPTLWVAVNATYYVGGQSSVNGSWKDDRQSNSRVGITAVIPTGRLSALKFAASTGAVVRIGADFNTYSIGWQKSWIGGMKKSK
jgi:hypothetical protein